MIKRALISVSDKSNLIPFAQSLISFGVQIISTGGTFEFLKQNNIPVTAISDVTRFPEILDGRVKTLHPSIHGGLLARRDKQKHLDQLKEHNISEIDLIVVNLYPFEKTTANPNVSLEEAIEQIDIGGPSMLRSAAKNYPFVTGVCDPNDYDLIISEMNNNNGSVSDQIRFYLATKIFQHTSSYDLCIASYLNKLQTPESILPENLSIISKKSFQLRYGENPHQVAALYGDFDSYFEKIHGKELSYNNIVDIQAAAELIAEFEEPAVAIIKHTNPCGCAVGESLTDAYSKALSTDPVSAFGGIAVFNKHFDLQIAQKVHPLFLEVIIAPKFSEEAFALLKNKKDRRIIIQKKSLQEKSLDLKVVAGGYLVQTRDESHELPSEWKIVTRRTPSETEFNALSFAWKVAKHVKSNAIVYTNDSQTLGVGAGQMSRVDSSTIAVMKAVNAGLSLNDSVVASDAFFPFADGLLEAVRAGATAVIQPGGSVRDAEVIHAADENNIAMVFTGVRHFKH